jgi:hypothetical protein
MAIFHATGAPALDRQLLDVAMRWAAGMMPV